MEITDPREARMKYNEQDPMDLEDDEFDKLPPAEEENWQVVGPKHKHVITPPISVTKLPLPTSPARSPTDTMQSNQTQKQPAKKRQLMPRRPESKDPRGSSTTYTSTAAHFEPQSNGSQKKFDKLTKDKEQWNLVATDLIHWMYQTTPEVQIHSWKNGPAKQVIPILELNPDNLHSLIAPKVTTIVSYKCSSSASE
jgi:hypothetical protein